jgi:hypothetical protein
MDIVTQKKIFQQVLTIMASALIAVIALYFGLFAKIFLPFVFTIAFWGLMTINKFQFSKQLLISLSIASIGFFVYQIIVSTIPHEWDFTCFYIYGVVASKGMDFYNPENFFQVVGTNIIPHEISDEFNREVLQVGFPYPPPSAFLFMPLSLFDYHTALVLWKIFNAIVAVGCFLLIHKIFLTNHKTYGIAIAIIFTLFTIPGYDTIRFSQTAFLLLLLLLLAYKYSDKLLGGVFISLAIFVKPFAIVFLIWFLLTKKYRPIVGFAIGSLIIFVVTVSFTGFEPFWEYIFNNPAHRQPEWLFTEGVNQSSLAVLLRAYPDEPGKVKLYYILINGIVGLLALLFVIKNRKNTNFSDYSWNILIGAMLLFYPSGQMHYNLIHIMGLFLLIKNIKTPLIKLLIVFLFFLMQYKGLFFTSAFIFLASFMLGFNMEKWVMNLSLCQKVESYFNVKLRLLQE